MGGAGHGRELGIVLMDDNWSAPFEAGDDLAFKRTSDRSAISREYEREQADIAMRNRQEGEKLAAENEKFAKKQRANIAKQSAAHRIFIDCIEKAKAQVLEEGLQGKITSIYETRYKPSQGIKAAIFQREDGIATLILQHKILQALHRLSVIACIALALLAYIAYRVT